MISNIFPRNIGFFKRVTNKCSLFKIIYLAYLIIYKYSIQATNDSSKIMYTSMDYKRQVDMN